GPGRGRGRSFPCPATRGCSGPAPCFQSAPPCKMRLSHIDSASMHWFSLLFLAALALATAARLWLSARHIRHIATHRDAVPPEFSGRIPLAAHQKAADYNVARARLGVVETLVGAALTLVLTFGGGLRLLAELWARAFQAGGYAHGIALIVSVVVVFSVV